MKYIITKTEAMRPYFGMSENDPNMYCKDMYTLFDLSCVEIAEPLFDTIYPTIPAGYEEVSATEAKYGTLFFSEVRDTVKIWNNEYGWAETADIPEEQKVPFTLTPEIKEMIRTFMYRFAKEIIETEYNYRFRHLHNTTELEKASWEIQKHEAREWLTYADDPAHVTPFLDYLAVQRSMDKTTLANKILEKSEQYQDNLSTMLVEYQSLIKQFKNSGSIWDINILYEKYLGIMMPAAQAMSLGLMDVGGVRIFEDPDTGETMVDQNNPKFGNKLNF
jgi:hypothetical protein